MREEGSTGQRSTSFRVKLFFSVGVYFSQKGGMEAGGVK